ncbi:MAG: MFS transporter [Gammaproteobacteria bacterium]|nr:MFS transporter [Gammaproteobacteria bacterium]
MRGFCDGLIAVLLPLHFAALGFGPGGLGLFASAALSGSALMTLMVGRYAGGIGYRPALQGAAVLMFCSGAAFLLSDQLWVLCAIAFVGTLNPSGGDVSVFAPIEHAVLAGSGDVRDRPGLFARYGFVGTVGAALGALAAGPVERLAPDGGPGAAFVFYALAGALTFVLYRGLCPFPISTAIAAPLGPSRAPIRRLAALFSLDSLAGGLVIDTLIAAWLYQRFEATAALVGVFFFLTRLCSACSYFVSARLAGRLGLVRTMVFTHLPANALLVAAAFAPDLGLTLLLLGLRSLLSQMDVPARTAYVMSIVTPEERPAAASLTAVPRSLAAALSPGISGWLLGLSTFGWPLVLAGSMKIAYDLTLWRLFRHVEPIESGATSRPPSPDS